MSGKTNQLLKGGTTRRTSPARRTAWPLRLAVPIVAGVAVLATIVGVLLLSNLGRGSSSAGSPAQVTGQPVLALDREQINFGKVPLDKPVKATFKISNAGDRPLQILNQPVVEVKQGC